MLYSLSAGFQCHRWSLLQRYDASTLIMLMDTCTNSVTSMTRICERASIGFVTILQNRMEAFAKKKGKVGTRGSAQIVKENDETLAFYRCSGSIAFIWPQKSYLPCREVPPSS